MSALQQPTYIAFCNNLHFASAKNRKVPVIIRVLKDDDAVVSMVDSNLQREMISPSEKAFA